MSKYLVEVSDIESITKYTAVKSATSPLEAVRDALADINDILLEKMLDSVKIDLNEFKVNQI